MEYLGGITEFNYNPIQTFNNQLKNSRAFEVPTADDESFDKIFESKLSPKEGNNNMGSFMSRMSNAFYDGLNSVNNDAIDAEQKEEILASGGDISAHEVMIAAEKSQLSLQMAVQIRNRLLNAYTEINNMQL